MSATLSRRELLGAPLLLQAAARRPNVVLVITDDQGYGDLSLHGNPVLRTPHIDAIGREGVRFEQFHVSPVCAPTRASLMTGRWNYRTGVVDTYIGRAMMRPEEVTVAECLRGVGYRTGIFGKWHLGDNAPLRPSEQGFETSLTHRGGGLAQPSSPPGTGYFDPPLERDNKPFTGKGYCTDIFFDEALQFIERHRREPFFAYISTNAPHTPLEIGDEWVAPYRGRGLNETTEKIYGMVANIDRHVGRLTAHLRQLGLEQNTLLMFLTDNGPQQPRYNAGLRGLKGTVYQGGIRVPMFARWPGRLAPGRVVEQVSAHVDLMPTLLETCGVPAPTGRRLDGVSLLPWMEGRGTAADRALFLQWHRGDAPEPWRQCCVRTQRWKLVNGKELYNLAEDPGERTDVSRFWPAQVSAMRQRYEDWFADVGAQGYEPPRIWVGSELENPVLLTRQDWRGPRASWTADGLGYYEVDVRRGGRYNVRLLFPAAASDAKAVFELGSFRVEEIVKAGATEATFPGVVLERGPGRAEGRLELGDSRSVGVHYLEIKN